MDPKQATTSRVLSRDEIKVIEATLGLPANTTDWYAKQRKVYEQWHNAAWFRQSTFEQGTCHHCSRKGVVVTAAQISICATCLQTGIPWYPTGWVQPSITALLSKQQRFTSRS